MAVSGTNTFTQLKNQLIKQAYRRIGVLSEDDELTTYQINQGSDILNMMIKAWIAQGIRIWKIARGTLFLNSTDTTYVIDGSSAHATENYTETALASAATSAATSISVESATGFVVGYNIGVVQDNNTIHWTTVSSVVGTTIGLTDATTYDAASGNAVYVYQTKINNIYNLVDAQCWISSTLRINMQILSRRTYDSIAIPNQQNISNQIYFNRQLDSSGKEYAIFQVFGVTPTVANYITFSFEKQFFDMTNPTDNFDFPSEWYEPIYLNLATRLLGFNAIKDQSFIANLKQEASDALQLAKGFDDEMTSVYFFPASDNNRGDYL